MYQYRLAEAGDLKRIAEIELRSQVGFNPSCLEKYENCFDTRYRWWCDYFDRTSRAETTRIQRAIYVAMVKLNIVGYIAGHLTSRPDPQGEIQSMNILKPQLGKGVEVNLLRKLARWFKNQGAASVCVNVIEHDPHKELYAQHGAKVVNDSLCRWEDIDRLTEKS